MDTFRIALANLRFPATPEESVGQTGGSFSFATLRATVEHRDAVTARHDL
jgi:hypothetical protein